MVQSSGTCIGFCGAPLAGVALSAVALQKMKKSAAGP